MSETKTFNHRFIIIIFLLTITLTSLYMTISLAGSFSQRLYLYIDSLIPSNSISFTKSDNSSITGSELERLNDEKSICHAHLYPDDYQLIGVGEVRKRYESQYAYRVIDDSRYYDSLLLGKPFSNNDEVVISQSLAAYLSTDGKLETVVGKQVNLWYKHFQKVKGKEVKITGISNDESLEIYDGSAASIEHVQEIFEDDQVSSHYGILYVQDKTKDYHYLSSTYKTFHFTIVGQTTWENAHRFINKTTIILSFLTLCLGLITVLFFYYNHFRNLYYSISFSIVLSFLITCLLVMILNGLFAYDLLYDYQLFEVDYGLFMKLYLALFLIAIGLKRGFKLKNEFEEDS